MNEKSKAPALASISRSFFLHKQ